MTCDTLETQMNLVTTNCLQPGWMPAQAMANAVRAAALDLIRMADDTKWFAMVGGRDSE